MVSSLKKTKLQLQLLTDIDILLMTQKRYQRRYAEANAKYMKDHYKDKDSLHLTLWDVQDSDEWAMSPKLLPVKSFELTDHTSQVNKNVIKKYKETSNVGNFLS